MGVLPPFITLLVITAVGHAAAAAGAEEATMVRPAAGVQQAGTTTLCCSNMTGYHECVVACSDYYPREQAAQICDSGCQEAYQCRTMSGDKCPNEHPSSSDPLVSSVAGEEVPTQLAGTLCCSNMTGFRECVVDCFGYFPREQAEKICDPGCQEACQCHPISGDECPSGHPSSSGLLAHSAEKAGNAVDHCWLGCTSSVCSKMVTGKKGVVKLLALERCNKACYKFCTKGGGVSRAGTSTA